MLHDPRYVLTNLQEELLSFSCRFLRHDETPAWWKKTPKKRTVQIINLTPTSTKHISLTFLPLCWEKVIGCVQVCMELDRSVFFPGPLGAWYGKNVPHYGGKFLHCQHEPTVGFHNRHLHVMGSANMLSFLFFFAGVIPQKGFFRHMSDT